MDDVGNSGTLMDKKYAILLKNLTFATPNPVRVKHAETYDFTIKATFNSVTRYFMTNTWVYKG